MNLKTHRNVYRYFKERIEKKFNKKLKVYTIRYTTDTQNIHKIKLFIYLDNLLNEKGIKLKDVVSFIKSFPSTEIYDTYIMYKHSKEETIQVEFHFFDNLDKLNFNLNLEYDNSFYFLFNTLLQSYNCYVTRNGLFHKETDILLTNNFEDILRLFGYDINRFEQPFTKEQFSEYFLNKFFFCNKNFIKMDENISCFNTETISLVYQKVKVKKLKSEPCKQILNEIQRYTDPENAVNRLKDEIIKKSKELYESLIYTYINRSTTINIMKFEQRYRSYLNKIIETYHTLFKDKQLITIDDKNIEVNLLKSRITKIDTDLILFQLIDINNKNDQALFGFKSHFDINFKEFYIVPNIFNETSDILSEACNVLNNYLYDELNIDFNFIIREQDIHSISSYLIHQERKSKEIV